MNNLAPLRYCPRVQGKLNWMPGYIYIQYLKDMDIMMSDMIWQCTGMQFSCCYKISKNHIVTQRICLFQFEKRNP